MFVFSRRQRARMRLIKDFSHSETSPDVPSACGEEIMSEFTFLMPFKDVVFSVTFAPLTS